MSGRIWIFVAAILGGTAVAAGAIGAHALGGAASDDARRMFATGQQYHLVHALALLSAGIVIAQSEGRRARFAAFLLQFAAIAFLTGIVCFSGGLYVQALKGLATTFGVVPFGGMALMAGWAALAIGALGAR